MKTQRQLLGARGEQAAASYLEGRGYQILGRNWRCPAGELDLVARGPDGTVLAVEVKTRSSAAYGTGFEAVNAAKHRRLHRLLIAWSKDHGLYCPRLRIDVVEVWVAGADLQVTHHRDVRS